jgi:acyl carrier protein
MPSPVFNTIAAILAKDFRLTPEQIRPDAALIDLGLDSLALMEFVFAVEDSFRLRIPEDRLDPREAGITLDQLSQVVEAMLGQETTAYAPLAAHA